MAAKTPAHVYKHLTRIGGELHELLNQINPPVLNPLPAGRDVPATLLDEAAPRVFSAVRESGCLMRVGVYIDGLNLYYGGRSRFGRGTSGWRWLDLRQLGERLLTNRNDWTAHGAAISRVVYCTALVDTRLGQGIHRRQQVYLAALQANSSFDHLEQGRFALRLKTAQLATRGRKGQPVVHTSRWPIMVRDSHGRDVHDARFVVSYLNSEEKAPT